MAFLTKAQRKEQKRIDAQDKSPGGVFQKESREKYSDAAYVRRQAGIGARPGTTVQEAIDKSERDRIETDRLINDFDTRANEAFAAGDFNTATGLRGLADDIAAHGGTISNIRNIVEPRDRLPKKKGAAAVTEAEPESHVYSRDASISWVADVATMQAGNPAMISRIPNAAQKGLHRMQSEGYDLRVRREAAGAKDRLDRYGMELLTAALDPENLMGQRVLRSLAGQYRIQGYSVEQPGYVEQRIRRDMQLAKENRDAASTITSNFAYFVPPVVFSSAWQNWRAKTAPILSVAKQVPLPTSGMSVLVPTLSSPVGVQSHSEGWGSFVTSTAYSLGASITRVINGVEYLMVVTTAGTTGSSEPTWNTTLNAYTTSGTAVFQTQARPSLTYEGSGTSAATGWDQNNTSPVLTYSGSLSCPQALLDRNAVGGMDAWTAQQVSIEAHSAFGYDILGAILNSPKIGATATSGSAAYNIAAFWTDFNSAAQTLETTDGVSVSPDYLGAKSAICRGLMSAVDDAHRPVFGVDGFVPTGETEGRLATLPGNLGLFREEQLESFEDASGLVLVGSAEKGLLVMEGEPIIAVYPEYAAGSLTAIITVRSYAAAAVLFAGGAFTVISGNAVYPKS